jgi:hypothetical protein
MSSIVREREQIDASWDELNRAMDALGPDELSITGPDGWAVKDHLFHVAAWELSLIALLEGRDRLAEMGVPGVAEDTTAINEAIWRLHREEPDGAALDSFRETHRRLITSLGRLSDEDLGRPYSHFQPSDPDEKRPVAGWIAGNTYEHYAEHVAWMKDLIAKAR